MFSLATFSSDAEQDYASKNYAYDEHAESGEGLFDNEYRDQHCEQDASFSQDGNRCYAFLAKCPDDDRAASG